MKDPNMFIDFTDKNFNMYNNQILDKVVAEYLEDNPDISWEKIISSDSLVDVLREILAHDMSHVVDSNELYHQIENIYDYWRNIKRYLTADLSKTHCINTKNYLEVFDEFNKFVLQSYRKLCNTLLGHNFTIMRELPAGGNAFVLLDKSGYNTFDKLADVRFVSNVVFRPPFVIYSKSNKRTGVFPLTDKNPLDTATIDTNDWLCFPILVGKSKVFFYFKKRYVSLGLALSNLFEHDDDFRSHKPDMIVTFGTDVEDGIFHDKVNDVYIANLKECDKIDYFGYVKKIILTVHNIKMIETGKLPIHGAGVSLVLKDHRVKNVVMIGDSGAGKSETLEALRTIAADYVISMTTIFDDMGTFALEDGKLKAYGTEIGAFVRTDDMENGYAYKVFDRAIFMNPNMNNSRLVIPVATHDDIVKGVPVDYVLYANNYEESDKKLKMFANAEEAIAEFSQGKRMAKGTTSEMGLVQTFFANPFGPVQLESKTRILLDQYFNYFYENGIHVGEIYTGLGLPNGKENPVKAATELLKSLKEE